MFLPLAPALIFPNDEDAADATSAKKKAEKAMAPAAAVETRRPR